MFENPEDVRTPRGYRQNDKEVAMLQAIADYEGIINLSAALRFIVLNKYNSLPKGAK